MSTGNECEKSYPRNLGMRHASGKQKWDQAEQRKETEKLEQEKARQKRELMKEDPQKLCSHLGKDIESSISKADVEKKSAPVLAV